MKKVLVLLLFSILAANAGARQFRISENLTIEGEVISSSSVCMIVEAKDEAGRPIFWILSEIVNAFLPDVANFVCLKIAGEDNQEICDAIADGISFVTSAIDVGKGFSRLIGNAIEFFAERGSLKSAFRFTTESLKLAYNVKSTLEAYEKLGIIRWDSMSESYVYTANDYVGNITLENVTASAFTVMVSRDGVTWYTKTILPGKFAKLSFWESYAKQDYGFVKGTGICNYQLFTDKRYRIRYSKLLKQYYIEVI